LLRSDLIGSWYRAPELLYGANQYSVGVDMWAMGCVMAELVLRTPLFPGLASIHSALLIPKLLGKTDIEQLALIFNCFGTPTSEAPPVGHPLPGNYWPSVESLPNYLTFEERTADGGFDFSLLLR
jgi:cyclin-dependent kinase 7